MRVILCHLLPEKSLAGVTFAFLLAVVFTLPLAIVPAATDSFVLSKEVLLAVATVLLVALAVASAACGAPWRIPLQPVNGVVVAMLVWMAISMLWSVAPALAREELWRAAICVVFFFLFQSLCGEKRSRLLAVGAAAACSTLIASMWTVYTDFRRAFSPGSIAVREVLGDWRDIISTVAFGNTSHLGDFLAFGFLLWSAALLVSRHRVVTAIGVAALWLHAAGLIVAWSVHSNVSLVIAMGFFVFLLRDYVTGRDLVRHRGRFAALMIGWVAVVGFYVVDHPLNPHGSSIWAPKAEVELRAVGIAPPPGGFSGGIFSEAFSSPRWTSGWDTRLAIWLTTLDVIQHHPWLGTGAGTFVYTYPATRSALVMSDPRLAPYGASWTNAAHNDLLQFWSELGILGPMLLVLIVGAALKGGWDRLRAGTSFGNAVILGFAFSALVGQCLQMQMNFVLQLPVSTVILLCLAAVPHMLPGKGKEQSDLMVPVQRPFGPVLLGITMKNMAYPVEVRVWGEFSKAIGVAVSVVAFALAAVAVVPITRPLRADILYRDVYEGKRLMAAGRSVVGYTELLRRAEEVLVVWPAHVDCRSSYQDMLLKAGRYEAVVEQTPRVLEKLNATEVYERRAVALTQLGRSEEANGDWDEVFRRRPEYGGMYPAPFAAYLARHPSAGKSAP